MVIFTHRRPNEWQVITWNLTTDSVNGQWISIFKRSFGFTSNEALAFMYNIFNHTVKMRNLGFYLSSNSNTVDGAQMVARISSVDTVFKVVFDQATGRIFNTDVFEGWLPLLTHTIEYNQGDNKVNLRGYYCEYLGLHTT